MSSPLVEWGPSLTEDGLLIVFGRNMGNKANRAFDLWVATRKDDGEPFDAPVPLDELNTPWGEYDPNISADGLTILFDSARSGNVRMYVATRTTRDDPFEEPERLGGELDNLYWDANLSADGLKLYFTDGRKPTDLVVATRERHDEPFAFGNVQRLEGINTPIIKPDSRGHEDDLKPRRGTLSSSSTCSWSWVN